MWRRNRRSVLNPSLPVGGVVSSVAVSVNVNSTGQKIKDHLISFGNIHTA